MAELFAKYSCTNCQEDIQGIRVHCAECPDFELCLQCFAAGAEIGNHSNDHAFQFMDSGILGIFRGKCGWSAREELHLLDAIEQFGFGNWEDISKHIETRSPEDAKEEYVNKFLVGTIGKHTWLGAHSLRPQLTDHTENDKGPLSQLLTQRLPPVDVTQEEAQQLGYMPNRDDFEREYDPQAEQLVSTLALNENDDDVDIVLKLAQIDIYTRKLRERARRKRQVRDYQLVANFFRGNARRMKQTRDQREFRDKFRVFAQFYTSHEFDRIISSIDREKALRVRLAELNRYRWNGLTRIDECIHFEQHAVSANHRTGPYGMGRTDHRQSGERQMYSMQSQLKRSESTSGRSSNFTGQKSTLHTVDQAYSDGLLPSKNYSDNIQGQGPSQSQSSHHQQARDLIAQNPGRHLLSSNEIQLCSSLNLPPTKYLTLKTVILSGASSLTSMENQVKIFFKRVGWLRTNNQF